MLSFYNLELFPIRFGANLVAKRAASPEMSIGAQI